MYKSILTRYQILSYHLLALCAFHLSIKYVKSCKDSIQIHKLNTVVQKETAGISIPSKILFGERT